MAYREAKTDAEKKRGKSTDELSFEEALSFFKKRGKEKGASKFRWRGDAYNLDGEKIGGSKKTKGTTSSKGSTTSAPESSARPKQRQKGRGEPNYGEAADKPTSTPMGGPRRGRKPTETKAPTDQPIMPRVYTPEEAKTQLLRSKNVSFGEWEGMSRQERKDKGLPTTTAGWQNREFLENPMAWAKKQLGIKDKGTSGGSGGRRTTGNREYNKGGMVKSGNKDYKKSGMFYKSGSPRGYK